MLSSPNATINANTAQNTYHCDHSTRRAWRSAGRCGLSGGNSRIATTGPTSTPIMWLVAVSASRYTIMRRWWSCPSPGGWSSQRTISHNTSAIESSDSVYTFSFTTDWFHTVNAVAVTTALVTAASRLIRSAYPAASGSSPQAWAMMTNSGLPGGCGMPSTYAAAMYSEVSQNCVVGASVATYRIRAPSATQPASR